MNDAQAELPPFMDSSFIPSLLVCQQIEGDASRGGLTPAELITAIQHGGALIALGIRHHRLVAR